MGLFNKKPKQEAKSPIQDVEVKELDIPDEEELPEVPNTTQFDEEEEELPKKKKQVYVKEEESSLTEEEVITTFTQHRKALIEHEKRIQALEAFVFRHRGI
jgi:hypothetical protein